jgi:hypothetical protein
MKRTQIIRRERIEECLRHAPTAVAGGTLNAMLASMFIWSSGKHLEILIWLSAICLCGAARIAMKVTFRGAPEDYGSDLKEVRRIEWISLANGIVWGSGLALASFIATPLQFNILAALSGGMMGAAILTYGSMARAALMFICPIGVGAVLSWSIYPNASSVVGLVLTLNYLAGTIRQTN